MKCHLPIALSMLLVIASCASRAADGATEPDPAQIARGRRLFLQCSACHQVTRDSAARIGPGLGGVVGRPVASVPGYGYSKALASLSFVWDDAQLDRWIQSPTQVAPETAMAFAGIPEAADRKAVIAYLKTLK